MYGHYANSFLNWCPEISSKMDNLNRLQVVSDAVSSKAVVLMLIICLLFLLMLFCWSLFLL